MKKSTLRTAIACLTGFLSWGAITIATSQALESIGIPTTIYLDEPVTMNRYYGREIEEYETDTLTTLVGTASNFIAITLAVRIGMAINACNKNGGVSKKGNLDCLTWIYGLFIVFIGGSILELTLRTKPSLNTLTDFIEIGLIGIAFYLAKKWRDKKINQLKQ